MRLALIPISLRNGESNQSCTFALFVSRNPKSGSTSKYVLKSVRLGLLLSDDLIFLKMFGFLSC